MSNIVPVLHLLGLPLSAGTQEVLEAIKDVQRQVNIQKQRADVMEQAFNEDHARLKRAENPDNWRVVWYGDESTANLDTTALTHGNLVELAGVGQVMLHFRPCCQNLRCECTTRRLPGGYCTCHDNDE